MWRPKNWIEEGIGLTRYSISTEIYSKKEVELGRKFFIEGLEAGADAMLEALENESHGEVIWFGRTDSGDLLIYSSTKEEQNGTNQ